MKKIVIAILVLSLPVVAFAAAPGGTWDNTNYNTSGATGTTQGKGGGNNVPLDGGLSLLIAAGAGYGVKRYAQAKKKDIPATANK